MTYQLYFPIQQIAKSRSISERALSALVGLSRSCFRQVFQQHESSTIRSIASIGRFFKLSVEVVVAPEVVKSECSTVAIAYQTERDGFDSWKLHFMDFVDEFRRSFDARLLMLPPPVNLDPKLKALMSSLVCALCDEAHVSVPAWARRSYFLEQPWFPAGMESLKAMALLESPPAFRRNNIFVLNNFLERV